MSIIITNKFGTQHNASGTHEGVDFVVESKVKFPEKLYRGRILYIGNEPQGLGKYIAIRCVQRDGKTLLAIFAHFDKVNVKVNDLVFGGHKLGVQGKTGNATGAHVHFELYRPSDGEEFLA